MQSTFELFTEVGDVVIHRQILSKVLIRWQGHFKQSISICKMQTNYMCGTLTVFLFVLALVNVHCLVYELYILGAGELFVQLAHFLVRTFNVSNKFQILLSSPSQALSMALLVASLPNTNHSPPSVLGRL